MGRARARARALEALVTPAERVAALLAPLCAVTAAVALAAAVSGRIGRAAARLADVGAGAALVAALLAFGLRWHAAGHLPVFGTYESSLALTLAVLAAGAWLRAAGAPAPVWAGSCAVAAALAAHGATFDRTLLPLTISERSWVVEVHAWLAWAAFGSLAAAAALGARLGWARGDGAALEAAQRLLPRVLSAGFVLHSAMLVSGSFYEFLLFGRAWSFDPVETLGLAAWLAYGTLLHMHLLAGWSVRRVGRWSLLLFLGLVVSYRGIVYFPAFASFHIFDMDRRMHISPAASGGER